MCASVPKWGWLFQRSLAVSLSIAKTQFINGVPCWWYRTSVQTVTSVKDLIDFGIQNADVFFTPINSILSNIGQDNKNCALNICVDTNQIIFILFLICMSRVIHLTESRWLNEFDRNWWTWPKNWQRWRLTFEHDQKYNKYYHNNKH